MRMFGFTTGAFAFGIAGGFFLFSLIHPIGHNELIAMGLQSELFLFTTVVVAMAAFVSLAMGATYAFNRFLERCRQADPEC